LYFTVKTMKNSITILDSVLSNEQLSLY
jgi:hypothetical protein